MNTLKEDYAELVALTQLFLLREFSIKDKQVTDPQTYAFFKHILPKEAIQRPSVQTPPVKTNDVKSTASLPPPKSPPSPQPSPPQPSLPPVEPPPEPIKVESLPEKAIAISTGSKKGYVINLEPLSPPVPLDCKDIKQIFKEQLIHYPISEEIPSDQIAKKIKNSWQIEQNIPPIIILSFNEQEKSRAFLQAIADAISQHLAPARVLSGPQIEKEKKWDIVLKTKGLRLVIASDYGLYLLPELMKCYKETPKQAKHYLYQTPLLLLSDLTLYLKQPQLKPLLWKAICNEFNASRGFQV